MSQTYLTTVDLTGYIKYDDRIFNDHLKAALLFERTQTGYTKKAGESPEWIARQMGHSSSEMLFRAYSRFVPNLTRSDGSAFERLLQSNSFSGGAS